MTTLKNKAQVLTAVARTCARRLGTGDTDARSAPTLIQLYSLQRHNPSIAGVACGGRHTFAWLSNGHVFSFGNNFCAQLGYDFRIKNYKENQVQQQQQQQPGQAEVLCPAALVPA